MKKKTPPGKKKQSDATTLVPRADLTPTNNSVGKVAQILLNVDLRNSHDGLMEIAKQRGLDFNKVKAGQYLVFVNDQKNRFKLFALSPSGRGAIIVYYKSYKGRVDRSEIQSIPAAFGINKQFEVNDRMKEGLDTELKYKRLRAVTPIDVD